VPIRLQISPEQRRDRGEPLTVNKRPWYRRRSWLVRLVWGLLVATFWILSSLLGESPPELLVELLQRLSRSPFAAFWLIAVYLIRPFLLLPVTFLTVFSGFLFGAPLGIAYALVASLVSSVTVYALARVVATRSGKQPPAGSLAGRLQQHGFETVLTTRLVFVPGDLINYLSGALRVPLGSFVLATIIGGSPGLVMGVLAGTSIRGEFDFTGLRIHWPFLAASLGLLAVSLLVAAWLRRRGYGTGTP
jgi:uncharacterized membrane protein YdjX (TVP38/TMEM64 family)